MQDDVDALLEEISPIPVMEIVLKGYRNIRHSYAFRKTKPEFIIRCPGLVWKKQFTTIHKCMERSGEINETFQIELRKDETTVNLEVTVAETKWFFTKFTDKFEISTSVGESRKVTGSFTQAGGELDMEISYTTRPVEEFTCLCTDFEV